MLAGLFAAELDTELYNRIQELTAKQDQDPAVLFAKMVARQLALTADQGPEHIGVSAEKLERMENQRTYRNRSRYAQRALFQEERAEEEGRRERRGGKGRPHRDSHDRDSRERERRRAWREEESPRGWEEAPRAKRAPRKEEKPPRPPKAPAPPPQPRLNPDGTPMLNRRQRRALKFGNPMPEK